jgi:hypothetical protein
LNENNINSRIFYPAKLSFQINGAIKIFHNKQKQNHNRMGSIKPQEKKRQGIRK